MPRRVSHPTDVPVFARVAQRVLRVGDPGTQAASPGEQRLLTRIRQLHADQDGVSVA